MLKNKHDIDKSHCNTGKDLEKNAREKTEECAEAALQCSANRPHCDQLTKERAKKGSEQNPDRHKEEPDDCPYDAS